MAIAKQAANYLNLLCSMTIILLIICGLYAIFTLLLWYGWLKTPAFLTDGLPTNNPTAVPLPRLSVVIPVRNEVANLPALLADLAQQTYTDMEVIVVDDASDDDTAWLARQFFETHALAGHVLSIPNVPTASPKKRALTAGIGLATGSLIVTTDGDCRVGPRWLETLAQCYQQTHARMICGPVTFLPETNLFDCLQTVEGASLIGSGAATLRLGLPTMCNGANLCYEKRVFIDIGGFSGSDHLASGDDEFLMHAIFKKYSTDPEPVQFLKSRDAVVQTGPHRSWLAFYGQRKRWASKWRHYASVGPSVVAVFVFLSNLAVLLAPVGAALGWWSWAMCGLALALKWLPELGFLSVVLADLGKRPVAWFIPLTQIFYSLYVVFFGLVAQRRGFVWKGRNLT